MVDVERDLPFLRDVRDVLLDVPHVEGTALTEAQHFAAVYRRERPGYDRRECALPRTVGAGDGRVFAGADRPVDRMQDVGRSAEDVGVPDLDDRRRRWLRASASSA